MALSFGDFSVDFAQRLLCGAAGEIRLGNKEFDLLQLLIEQRPRALSKDEIFARLWSDTFVTEGNVATLVTGLRFALGDDANTYDRVDAEGVLNLALRWAGAHWNATLRANNVNDEEYDGLTSMIAGERSVYPAPGRAMYLTLGYSL